MSEMGNVYEKLLEEKSSNTNFAKGSFEVIAGKKEGAKKKEAFVDQKNTGPENADNVNVKAIADPKKLKNKETFQGVEKLSSQNFNENSEKKETKEINNFMSKSVFDKLFEDVMGGVPSDEQDALTLGAAPEADAGTEEGGDEVTISIPRDLAQKLHDVLMGVLEAGEAEGEAEGEVEGEAEAEGEDNQEVSVAPAEQNEEIAGEATELKELPASAGQSLQNKNNKVGDTTASLVSKGEGDKGNLKDADGKLKELPSAHGAKLQAKNNKVPNKHNTGDYLFKK